MDLYTKYWNKYYNNKAKSIKDMDNILDRIASTEFNEDPNAIHNLKEFSKEELIFALVVASNAVAMYREHICETKQDHNS